MSPPIKRMKLTKQTASIDDLPPEMICELFKHLPPKDLVVCSMVNKRWQSIYAAFKVHRLTVVDHLEERAGQPDLCRPKLFVRLANEPFLANLKYLYVSNGLDEEFKLDRCIDLNKLNRFTHLKHLEIDGDFNPAKVHLESLEILELHGCSTALSIDCPSLNVLVCYGNGWDFLELKHPETIRKLETNLSGPKLYSFKNVECLVTFTFEAISRETLLSMSKLKELHYIQPISDYYFEFNFEIGTLERMKRTLKEFVNDTKALRGSDFKFRFIGFDLSQDSSVDKIDFGLEVTEWFGDDFEDVYDEYVYLKNAHLIAPDATLGFINQFTGGLNEARVMSYVTGEIPACFLQKFELKSDRFVAKV